MDGPGRRLATALFAVVVGACQTRPVATVVPAEPSPTPPITSPAAGTPAATPTPTVRPSTPPVSVDLPDGFDAIPWARMPVSADTDEFVVTFGVLGKPPTGTRTAVHQPTVWADGAAILIEVDGATEILDAATGATIATFDKNALRLAGIPEDNLNYYLFSTRFRTDVTRGYIYDLAANRDGVQLRRFDLHGSNRTLLAKVAPDPGRDAWYVDFVLTDTGALVATACPLDGSKAADVRCRIYQGDPGGPVTRRFLPANAARPCLLLAASDAWLAGINQQHCRADGGPPQVMSYMALDLATLKTSEVVAPSDPSPFGIDERDGGPALVANLPDPFAIPRVYPPLGVVIRLSDPWYTVDRYVAEPEGPDAPGRYPGYVWSILGRGPGWTLLNGYSPAYGVCRLGLGPDSPPSSCASGPVVLETTSGRYELPPGTWGDIVPPVPYNRI